MKRLGTMLAAAAMAATLGLSIPAPAKADQGTTDTIILGAAALIAGVAIESNVAHKARLANTIVGYTPNGAAVYADNHVTLPNGQSYYPNNVGQTIACNNGFCTIGGNGYSAGYNGGYYGYYNGP